TLLVRDPEGNFSFLHQSVMEFLVARDLAPRLAREDGGGLLGRREMSGLMTDFVTSLAGRETAIEWARQVLQGEASESAKKNAASILKRAGAELGPRVDFAGRDLRGQDYSTQTLRRANLVGANLRDARLRGADLRGADLRGANLDCADLR